MAGNVYPAAAYDDSYYTKPVPCNHVAVGQPMTHHIAIGGGLGIDCCEECFKRASTIHIHSMFSRADLATWVKAHHQAVWLLAEKDAVIDELREQIDFLETEELE